LALPGEEDELLSRAATNNRNFQLPRMGDWLACNCTWARAHVILPLLLLAVLAGAFVQWARRPLEEPELFKVHKLRLVVRDFRQYGYPGGHADFQGSATPRNDVATEAVVERMLGADGKPVFRLPHPGVPGFTSNSSFREWFQTIEGVNTEENLCLQMHEDSQTGALVFEKRDFFPLDGLGFQDERPNVEGIFHNYYFTMEMHQVFVYRGGEMFSVRGEDDLWVFINGSLVIDFGGIHGPLNKSIVLDDLNLTRGFNATLDLFSADRRCCSSSFRVETTIHLTEGDPIEVTRCCAIQRWDFLCADAKKWWTTSCSTHRVRDDRILHTDTILDSAAREETANA
jgi:fibro-slime domain-containing protein